MSAEEEELDPLTESEGPPDRFPRQLRYALGLGLLVGALYVVGSQVLGPTARVDVGGATKDATPSVTGSDGGENSDAWRHNGPHRSPTVPIPVPRTSAPVPQPTGSDDGKNGDSSGGEQPGASPTSATGSDEGHDTEGSTANAANTASDDASTADPPASNSNPPEEGSSTSADAAAQAKTYYGSDFPKGLKPHPNMYTESYLPRARPLEDASKKQLMDRWGSWTFADPSALGRPLDDYYAKYPSRDVPRAVFPPDAWQIDPEYLRDFLPQAQALVHRTMEAILAEYGHGTDQEPSRSLEERSEMFLVTFNNDTSHEYYLGEGNGSTKDAGGYMNPKGYDGLVKRILHAVMTEDTFRVVMGGHSAAAGHGNHFQQSYTLQIQQILEPVFARLGVTMTAHNIGMGGLGTLQNAMGMSDMYGGDIDVLVYDAGYVLMAALLRSLLMWFRSALPFSVVHRCSPTHTRPNQHDRDRALCHGSVCAAGDLGRSKGSAPVGESGFWPLLPSGHIQVPSRGVQCRRCGVRDRSPWHPLYELAR